MSPAAAGERLTPVDSALDTLLASLQVLPPEDVAVTAALGRVLAQPVVVAHALPGCDNSAMDGFAVRAADAAAGRTLPIAGESRAGAPPAPHAAGTATRISTGAPLPPGADSVVRVEDTLDHGDSVTLLVAAMSGQNVRRAAEDSAPGDLMVASGRRLRAVDIAAAAAAGCERVRVSRRPRVAVIAGGDELVPAGQEPLPHQVVDSNTPLLTAAIQDAGGVVMSLQHAADTEESVGAALRDIGACDLVISTAGVSVGGHDHMAGIVRREGRIGVWKVAMRPGMPVLIGSIRGTPLLALPGNPVSAAITFEVFARPALLRLQGATRMLRTPIAVRLAEAVHTPTALQTYVRVTLEPGEDAIPWARLSGGQGSAMLRPLAAADALVVVPAGLAGFAAGEVVAAMLLE